ncbi:hypothetical protein QO002_002564 [Pararhizobium capsulatum DSM 1112]|uniref:Transposase n=1 Tax=Pararhizobium capsulatum DSM 1112 TaxID=1121113 RepID=A0ABU0BQB6_9HYPH|nr:hypothetical protein [Pararhizobium capsulatum DSM 1112]
MDFDQDGESFRKQSFKNKQKHSIFALHTG